MAPSTSVSTSPDDAGSGSTTRSSVSVTPSSRSAIDGLVIIATAPSLLATMSAISGRMSG